MRLILLGAPGAGKGTQGVRLADHYRVAHVSSGDILRQHVAEATELGRKIAASVAAGELVPDELVLAVIGRAVAEAMETGGYLLDGFPRTLAQARAAFEWGRSNERTFDAVILLEVPEDELVRRLVQRGREEGRADDTEDVIRQRLDVYEQNTAPLIGFYDRRDILVRVDGTGSVDEVTQRIESGLAAAGVSSPPAG